MISIAIGGLAIPAAHIPSARELEEIVDRYIDVLQWSGNLSPAILALRESYEYIEGFAALLDTVERDFNSGRRN